MLNKKYKIETIHIIYLCFFILLSIVVLFPLEFILVLLPDDSYYYFEIAKNVALKGESTFDTINKTNGFQPLWLILLVPIFFFKLDLVLTLRIIILFSGIILFITLIFIYRLVKLLFDNKTAEFCVMLYAFNPLYIVLNLDGTEAALNGLLLSGLFYYAFKTNFEKMNEKDFLIFGFLLSLSFLTRTDNIILISCIISFVTFSGMIEIRRENLKNLFYFTLALSLLPLIYISWNLINFNRFLPISGVVFGISFTSVLIYQMVIVIICSTLGLICRKREYSEKALKILILLIIAPILHLSYYLYNEIAGHGRFTEWYFVLPFICLTIFASFALISIFRKITLYSKSSDIKRRNIKIRALQLTSISLLFIIFVPLIAGGRIDNGARYQASIWINENTSEDSIIASANAGCLGYFTDRPLIEIGGLVNSYEFFEKYKGNKTAFLIEGDYDYYLDRKMYIPLSNAKMEELGLILVKEIEEPRREGWNIEIWHNPS